MRKKLRKNSSPQRESGPNGRRANGTFAPGNTASLIHGARSPRVANASLDGQELLRASLQLTAAGIVADLGGTAELTHVRRELVTRFTETSAIASYLSENILANGVLTTKGKTRAAVSTYLQVVDRLHRLAHAIGLDRRTKPTSTLDAFLAQREASRDGTGASDD